MKQKFKEIIEKGDNLYDHGTMTHLTKSEIDSAATNCETLAIEMMEKFLERITYYGWNKHISYQRKYRRMLADGTYEIKSGNDIVKQFISEQNK